MYNIFLMHYINNKLDIIMLKFTKILNPLAAVPKFSLITSQAYKFCSNENTENKKTYVMP
jgi:hypothetical protein